MAVAVADVSAGTKFLVYSNTVNKPTLAETPYVESRRLPLPPTALALDPNDQVIITLRGRAAQTSRWLLLHDDLTLTARGALPWLPPQTNRQVQAGTTLTVANTAAGNGLPFTGLIYTLLAAPAGAAIDSQGVITWTPGALEAGQTLTLTTRVTDNLVPPLSATITCDVTVGFSGAMPTAGLVGWWRAEGNGLDSVGGNDGVLNGVAFTAGQAGQAFAFDGASHWVTVPALPNWGTSSFSLGLWYRAVASGAAMALVNKGLSLCGAPVNAGYGLLLGKGTLDLQVVDAAGRTVRAAVSEPPGNTWHHLVATLDRTAGLLRLYVDGSLARETLFAGLGSLDVDLVGAFGATDQHPACAQVSRFLLGVMDEVMCYNRALRAEEVASLHTAQGDRPMLQVWPEPGRLRLSWPSTADGYGLVTRSSLTLGSWEAVTNTPSANGARQEVLLPAANPCQFFRLQSAR